jgi:alpha-glucosidase
MRSHSDWQAKNKEPWEYGAEFTEINRETINLRYRLLPYIYTTMAEAAVSGIPAMRPMMFDHPGVTRLMENDSQFMFGPDILVAPVLGKGETRKEVDLPPGTWYEYWTGTRTKGGNRATVAAPINRIPFFVRAGVVIPMRQTVQHTGEAPIDPLTLLVYPADGGTPHASSYYEDDGVSFRHEKGFFFRRTGTVTSSDSACSLSISAAEGSYAPPARMLLVKFQDCAVEPAVVSLDGRPVGRMSTGSTPPHWSYDQAGRTVALILPDRRSQIDISVRK